MGNCTGSRRPSKWHDEENTPYGFDKKGRGSTRSNKSNKSVRSNKSTGSSKSTKSNKSKKSSKSRKSNKKWIDKSRSSSTDDSASLNLREGNEGKTNYDDPVERVNSEVYDGTNSVKFAPQETEIRVQHEDEKSLDQENKSQFDSDFSMDRILDEMEVEKDKNDSSNVKDEIRDEKAIPSTGPEVTETKPSTDTMPSWIQIKMESPTPSPRSFTNDNQVPMEEPVYENLRQSIREKPKQVHAFSTKGKATQNLETDDKDAFRRDNKPALPPKPPRQTTSLVKLSTDTSDQNRHQMHQQSSKTLDQSYRQSPKQAKQTIGQRDRQITKQETLVLRKEQSHKQSVRTLDQLKRPTEQSKESHDRNKSSTKDNIRSNCLKEFLRNIGLDTEKNYKQMTKEGIATITELKASVKDEKKSSDLSSELRGINKEILNRAAEQENILDKLGLTSYFPEKITLQKAMEKSSNKLKTLDDVPWYFLTKMLMINYRGRDDLLPKMEKSGNGTEDDMFAILSEDTSTISSSSGLHPTDILVAVFQCSSNQLRQIISEKMFVCKLGVPLILPPFVNSKSTYLLWSLRNLTLGYKVSGEFCEMSLVRCPMPIVSCIKLGKIARSKSKFLNEILNGQSHDTFFHRDCTNGMLDRKLTSGIVEMATALPAATDSKGHFNRAVILNNIRGDGIQNEINMTEMLMFSNVNLVMVDVNELENPQVITSLKSIVSCNAQMLLMLTKQSNVQFDAMCKEAIKKCMEEIETESFKTDSLILDFSAKGEKNIKNLKEEVIKKINRTFDTSDKSKIHCLEHFKEKDFLKIKIDENITECTESHKVALALNEKVKNCKTESPKKDLLPLQCQLWHEWAKLTKEENRLQSKPNFKVNHADRKRELREEQMKCLEMQDSFVVSFIENLKDTKGNARHFFLKWLKLYLDEISRQRIPPLQKTYGLKWNEICQVSYGDVPQKLYDELDALEVKIAEASFGIEHLVREMGQCFEACTSEKNQTQLRIKETIDRLPQIAAELLLEGYPLELMDGDAAFVPVTWIKAVLKEVGELIGHDKKLFVLSVLGAQSSGKSTFLNTMFGLQFAVAAGRCTRGVYAQLVPVCKDDPNMKFDYILVVDTEGLKAPELSKAKFNHDNEIATLATGLGDVTLINVKGENVAEMEDVLQVVVHAILKMQLVNNSLELQPTCIFLHQNVSVPDAVQKMKSGQQKFMEIMDKVTKVTGEKENAPRYSKLKQVINFDINKHVWYFSDLWEGDPPMAPANPGYSDRVNNLKHSLLTDIVQKRKPNLTVSKLSNRIDDLWKGILQENFVFSLKNSLESRAYISLENKILELSMELQKDSSDWFNTHKSHNQENISKLLKEFESHLKEEHSARERKLILFLELSEDTGTLEQWRETAVLKLREACENIMSKMKNQLSNTNVSRQVAPTKRCTESNL